MHFHEDDISAEEEVKIQGSRFQGKNEYSWRKKSSGSKACKGKKENISIGHSNVAFFSLKKEDN